MKNKTFILLSLAGCALSAIFTSSALANHRTGDFALPEIMTAGDFNQDGNLDLAVNLSGFDNFAVLNGDGQGGFTLKSHIAADTLPKDVVSGDVNGDGKLDMVAITQWGYNIKVYLGDGTGGFQLFKVLNGDGEPNRLRLADLDKDGNLDILADGPAEGVMLIYFGRGGGDFSNSPLELEGYRNLVQLNTGDFNKDSNPDIAIVYYLNTDVDGTHLQIFLGDGAGNFTAGQNVVINSQCNNIEVNDLNKDGNLDLVLAGAGSENGTGLFISSYLGDGAGHFALKQAIDLGMGAIRGEISLGDFNEDGNMDIAFPVSTQTSESQEKSTDLFIYLGDGTGNFTKGQTVTVGKEPGSTWAADFNRDGHTDIACSNRTDATLSILLGNGNGTFATHATIQLNALSIP
jgi:FG-GAP-like repeat